MLNVITLSTVVAMVIVRTMSAMIMISRPSRIARPTPRRTALNAPSRGPSESASRYRASATIDPTASVMTPMTSNP